MKWTAPLHTGTTLDGVGGEWNGLIPDGHRQGGYLDKYTIGLAILWVPFFIAAHLLSIATGQPTNGFTLWYQVSISFAAAFYASLGCVMIYMLLRRYFSKKVSYFTVLTLLLGTNMYEYATGDGAFTHVYSLFLMATILYLIPVWYGSMTYKLSALLAALLALTALVRQTDALIVIVVLFWGVSNINQLRQRFKLFWHQNRKLVVMAVVGSIVFLPQVLYWKFVSGKWLVFSYRGERFYFGHPQIINILFSTDRGVFFWAPVLLIGIIGLVLMWRYLKEWSIAIYVFVPIWLWVVSSWWSWQFGESYGHRAFIDFFPLFALAIASVYNQVKVPILRKLLITFVCLCVFVNLFQTYIFWIHGIPGAGTTMHLYFHIWYDGLSSLVHNGFTFGFFGIVTLVGVFLGPLTHCLLGDKENEQKGATPT